MQVNEMDSAGTETPPPVERLEKVTVETAAEVAAEAELSEEAAALLGDEAEPPAAYLARLMAADHPVDAIRFLAHALPKREGAWWAAQCVRCLPLGDETALPRRTVRAAEAWVVDPSETARYAACELAEALGFDHPASWAAMAVFWAGDSLAPPDMPAVKPSAHLSCRAVFAAAVLAAAEKGPPEMIPAHHLAMLGQGIDIANGGTGRPPDGKGGPEGDGPGLDDTRAPAGGGTRIHG